MESPHAVTVSIVVAVYNSETFLPEMIASVVGQTFSDWELILVDDHSTDSSFEICSQFAREDDRIHIIQLEENSGAAIARNAGTEAARGRYLAFLDSDDIWTPRKLETQLSFMEASGCPFVFSQYEFMSESGNPSGRVAEVPAKMTYTQALRNTAIWTSTVMIDLMVIPKSLCKMPNVRRGQDTLTWFQILKSIEFGCGIQEPLAYYRQREGSLSSNKFTALKRTWVNYRKVEKLSFGSALVNFTFYVFNAIRRRM